MARIRSIAEIRDLFLQLWPEGQLYDWFTPTAWVSLWLDVVAQTQQQFIYTLLETLKTEIIPDQIVQKIVDWFEALGMLGAPVATNGSTAQQRAAVLSRLRESGGFDLFDVRAILAPLLGYVDPTTLVVLDDNWDNVDPTFTYGDAAINSQPFSAGTPYTREFWVYDGGKVNDGDLRVRLLITTTALVSVRVTVTSPTNKQRTWGGLGSGSVSQKEIWLRGGGDGNKISSQTTSQFAGDSCSGKWTVSVSTLGASGTCDQLQLQVNGDLAYVLSEWGIFADPALVGGNGNPPDYAAAYATIVRLQHAEAYGHLVLALVALPDAATSLPDTCYPQ